MGQSLMAFMLCILLVAVPEQVRADAVEYDIWVGGVRVTSENADNITEGAITAGTVSYDAEKNTLTLTNSVIGDAVVESYDEEYQNYSHAILVTGNADSFVIRLEGSNTLNCSGNKYSMGIEVNAKGSSSNLEIKSEDSGETGSLTVNLNCEEENWGGPGICAYSNLLISNCNVTVNGTNDATNLCYGILGRYVEFQNSTVKVTMSGTYSSASAGIISYRTLTITGSHVEAAGGECMFDDSDYSSMGINCGTTLTVRRSTVITSTKDNVNPESKAVSTSLADNSASYSYVWRTIKGGAYTKSNKIAYTVPAAGEDADKYVEFVQADMAVTFGGTTQFYPYAAAGWNAAVQKNTDSNNPVKVELLSRWIADTSTNSFGTGDGFYNGALYIPEGKYIVFDLNGYKVVKNYRLEAEADGYIVRLDGIPNLMDCSNETSPNSGNGTTGEICNGHNTDDGGGIYITENGRMSMSGGTIGFNSAGTQKNGGAIAVNGSLALEETATDVRIIIKENFTHLDSGDWGKILTSRSD